MFAGKISDLSAKLSGGVRSVERFVDGIAEIKQDNVAFSALVGVLVPMIIADCVPSAVTPGMLLSVVQDFCNELNEVAFEGGLQLVLFGPKALVKKVREFACRQLTFACEMGGEMRFRSEVRRIVASLSACRGCRLEM